MAEKLGAFVFVLHSHLPYVRRAGRWPHGEEMLHEAMAETYIPLLNALHELVEAGCRPRLTIGLTPILLEQMADADVCAHFELYLQERLTLIEADLTRHSATANSPFFPLARWYYQRYENLLRDFQEKYNRNLADGFRRLLEMGVLDVLTSAATHAYLPLMERDSTLYGQIRTGLEASHRHLGQCPQGIWLPECAYRPAYLKEDAGRSYVKPGLESFLAGQGLRYFFTDTHVVEGGRLVGKVAGDVVGPYGSIPARRWVEAVDETTLPRLQRGTTFRPYYVHTAEVAVFGRDESTGLQVWSASIGYPGDYWYREFHRKDDRSGLQYWRITGAGVELGKKELYDPSMAAQRVQEHADHFVGLVRDRLAAYRAQSGQYGCLISAYDTELFGHWWYEGIDWMKEVLRQLSTHPDVELTTARAYLDAHPPTEVLDLPESSWGAGGTHWTWLNPDTEWVWPLIHHAERRMEALVARYPDAQGELRDVLNQAARELVLLEASDWPFLITTGQAKEYASGRFQQHAARFHHLAQMAESGALSEADRRFLRQVMELDNPFPTIDYRNFRAREGMAA